MQSSDVFQLHFSRCDVLLRHKRNLHVELERTHDLSTPDVGTAMTSHRQAWHQEEGTKDRHQRVQNKQTNARESQRPGEVITMLNTTKKKKKNNNNSTKTKSQARFNMKRPVVKITKPHKVKIKPRTPPWNSRWHKSPGDLKHVNSRQSFTICPDGILNIKKT